jgi:hypothetical protein
MLARGATTAQGDGLAELDRRRDSGSAPVKAIQVHESYLIAETGDGMVVIDQHALHERILYEELKSRIAAGQVESQRLLVPETVDLNAAEVPLVLEHGELLAKLGLEIEGFGGDTVLVRTIPAMLRTVVPERLVRDLAEHLRTQPLPPTREGVIGELLHMIACKAAVKAGPASRSRRRKSTRSWSAGIWSPIRITAPMAGRLRSSSPKPIWRNNSGEHEVERRAALLLRAFPFCLPLSSATVLRVRLFLSR